jgi:hypothetical protein
MRRRKTNKNEYVECARCGKMVHVEWYANHVTRGRPSECDRYYLMADRLGEAIRRSREKSHED